ncbi:MAG: hypothetical protein WA125_06425 [Desulfosporosinus sp.]
MTLKLNGYRSNDRSKYQVPKSIKQVRTSGHLILSSVHGQGGLEKFSGEVQYSRLCPVQNLA